MKLHTHEELLALIAPELRPFFKKVDDETVKITYMEGDEAYEKTERRPHVMFKCLTKTGQVLVDAYGVAHYMRNPELVTVDGYKPFKNYTPCSGAELEGIKMQINVSKDQYRRYKSIDGQPPARVEEAQHCRILPNGDHELYLASDGEAIRGKVQISMDRCYMISWEKERSFEFLVSYIGNPKLPD